jgi:hypothetical protein
VVPPDIALIPTAFKNGMEGQPLLRPLASNPNYHLIQVTHVKDTQLFDDVQQSFNHFIQSGQAWALAIGFFLGYFLRGLTR